MFLVLQLFVPETEEHTQFPQVREAETCMSANEYLTINEEVPHLTLVQKVTLKICSGEIQLIEK